MASVLQYWGISTVAWWLDDWDQQHPGVHINQDHKSPQTSIHPVVKKLELKLLVHQAGDHGLCFNFFFLILAGSASKALKTASQQWHHTSENDKKEITALSH